MSCHQWLDFEAIVVACSCGPRSVFSLGCYKVLCIEISTVQTSPKSAPAFSKESNNCSGGGGELKSDSNPSLSARRLPLFFIVLPPRPNHDFFHFLCHVHCYLYLAGSFLHRCRRPAFLVFHLLVVYTRSHRFPYHRLREYVDPATGNVSGLSFWISYREILTSWKLSSDDLSSFASSCPPCKDVGGEGSLKNSSPGNGYCHCRSFFLQPQHVGSSLVQFNLVWTHFLQEAVGWFYWDSQN